MGQPGLWGGAIATPPETIADSDAIVWIATAWVVSGAMVDWLVIWGVAQAAGLVFKPILEELAQDSAKDYAKDFFKDCLKQVIRLPEKDAQKEAYGKALKEFLQFVQQELEDADYQDAQIKHYTEPLRYFIQQDAIAATLGRAFDSDCNGLDLQLLAHTWQRLNLPTLPPEFNWERVSKRYLKRVKAIVQESDALRPIFAAQVQTAMADGVKELVGIAPEFDMRRYAEGLREQYGNLKLESLDTTGVYYSELKLWKVFVPQNVRECQEFLPQVYEIPKEHGRRLRQSGQLDEVELVEAELERSRRVYGEQPIRPILDVVGDPTTPAASPATPTQHAVILGDPGSGKSTLLQYIALIWAERPLRELPLHPIPLLLELRTYARDKQTGKCQDLLAFIHGGNVTCRLNQQQLHDTLKTGQAIVLFDGIDEVFDPNLRDEVVTDIHRFTNDYPTVQVIVTSRWLGYKAQRLRDAGFQHFMLQDLDDAQIAAFMQRWHDLTFADTADKQRKQERLQKAIQESKAIRELAGNPLLLTMMAILNRNQELPRDRPELYNQASRVLLHQWDVERALVEDHRLDPKTIDYRDKQAMLRKVAYHMQSSQKGLAGNIISATDLETILAESLKSLEVAQPRTVARLMINQLRTRNFILCYLGVDSYAFVHRTFLEYFCAWEFVWQFKETQTLTIEQLKLEVFGQHWQDESWHEVLRLVGVMIEPKFTNEITQYLLDLEVIDRIHLNLSLVADCFLDIKNRIAFESTYKNLIKRCFLYGSNYGWTQRWSKDGFSITIESSLSKLISSISTIWKDDPRTLSWLKDHISSKVSQDIRGTALQELVKVSKNKPETLHTLKALVLNSGSSDPLVQCVAVHEIAKSWRDDVDTVSILKNSASYACKESLDDNVCVLRAISLRLLVLFWKDEPGIFDFLWERTFHDPFVNKHPERRQQNPRKTAIDIIFENYSDNPKIIELMRDRAQNDPDKQVREFAKQQLAKLETQK